VRRGRARQADGGREMGEEGGMELDTRFARDSHG
jgi:hypothetical protein